ncbi:EAL domain-containing protein [Hassallia byssoidea VB512170]|uniref:EAL domain-containing protein n=1 Tax=Hassallia byssoidea VB512170 TaxID=1304833 RepID=A0A846HJN8_9CYAN|nr:EAL domain-containing protein [Hassalia byssoidea]NEU76864.1 EAL domain-containing protein [Hassalia byssoidea VB512170]
MSTPNEGDSHISRTLFRWQRRIPPKLRYVAIVAIYLILWAILDKVSLAFETTPEIQIWYPPSALDFVLVLVFGVRYAPALLLNTFVHQYVVTHRDLDLIALLIFDLVTTIGYAGASALLLLKLQINPRLRQLRDVVCFNLVAVLIAPLFVAWLQVLNFASSGIIPWSKLVMYTLHYWAGDATGIAMLAPFLLISLRKLPWVWSHKEQQPPATEGKLRLPTWREVPELLGEGVALAAGILTGYGAPRGTNLDYTYFAFLPVIWSALRHGFERAATTVLLMNVGVALLVIAKFGSSNLLVLQFGLMAISLMGLLVGAIATDQMHTEKALRDSNKQLTHNAFHDGLTGLANRSLFMEHLERAVEYGKRDRDFQFAVLFVDLDRFKLINDSLGHLLGDKLLIAIVGRLQACVRPTDIIARFGGDEFTILLENLSDVSDTIRVADRIQTELSLPFNLSGQEVFITASIGIALSATGYNQAEDLMRDADIAMYRAKLAGKARYEIFNPSMHDRAVLRLQLETDLRLAIERQEFLIHYQPMVSLSSGKIIGFESLLRWQHPERGLLFPGEFISVAEEAGLMSLIDEWVMRQACHQIQQWQEQIKRFPPLSISVNVCNKHFTQPNLVPQISKILQQTSLDACCLKLEITENVIMENHRSATATLSQLKALGIRLVIDDFGTGYSSLSRLHRFPIDELKIDRSFVSNINANEKNLEITEIIVMLGKKLGLDVTAEGIETKEQLAQLKQMKCAYGQGRFFSQPLSGEAAKALIVANPQW